MQPISDANPVPTNRDPRRARRRRLVHTLLVAFAVVDAALIFAAVTK